MKRLRLRTFTTPLTLLLMTAPLAAHHSLAGEFDPGKPVTIQGVITEVKWENPHIWFHIAATDGGGVVNWAFEGAPPAMMRQAGVQPSLFKVGDRVTINGYRARDSSRTYGHAFDLVLADGRRVIIGRKL
jgi:hypothetical protein